jgi:hypothetical protein
MTETRHRETWSTCTFKTSAELQEKGLKLWVDEVQTITDAAGILPALVFQPITKKVISSMSKNGENALDRAQ